MNWHERVRRRRRAFVIARRNGHEISYRLFCAVWRDVRAPRGEGERWAA